MRRQQTIGNRQQGEEKTDNIRLLAMGQFLEFVHKPAHIAIYRKKEYLAREQDAPTAMLPNKDNDNYDHYNAPPPII